MGLLDHRELMIVKGVGPIPGDENSAEQPLVALDLLSEGAGFSLSEWSPNIPSLKSGGVWADSSISDGRTLIAGANTNVTETMVVNLTAASGPVFAATFSALQQMAQDARAFWDSLEQIEPVYLRWWACGAPGPQFALLYNIDMDVEYDDSTQAAAEITLTLEREEGWHGIHIGGNPREWTLGSAFNADDASLIAELGQSDDLIDVVINNRAEYDTTSKQTYLTQNFIDIDAADVPGDLPALLQLYVAASGGVPPSSTTQVMFVSRYSVPPTSLDSSFTGFSQALSFNAADCTLGANTTVAADTGAPVQQSSGVARRGVFTPVDNNEAVRFLVDDRLINSHRGRFHVFVRARQHSGAQGDLSMRIVTGTATGFKEFVTTPSVAPTRQDGTGNTTDWPVHDLGVIEIPISNRLEVSLRGKGAEGDDGNLVVWLYARRVAGTTAVLYVCDIILIPLSEPSGRGTRTNSTDSAGTYYLDSTGYLMHGSPELFFSSNGPTSDLAASEYAGPLLTLLPNVDQRLYFFMLFSDNTSRIEWPIEVHGNIVPRWLGIRTV